MNIEDQLEDIGFWVMLPTVRLTERSKNKAVRVLGALAMFPLFPLLILGMSILMISMLIGMYKEI